MSVAVSGAFLIGHVNQSASLEESGWCPRASQSTLARSSSRWREGRRPRAYTPAVFLLACAVAVLVAVPAGVAPLEAAILVQGSRAAVFLALADNDHGAGDGPRGRYPSNLIQAGPIARRCGPWSSRPGRQRHSGWKWPIVVMHEHESDAATGDHGLSAPASFTVLVGKNPYPGAWRSRPIFLVAARCGGRTSMWEAVLADHGQQKLGIHAPS